MAAPVTQAVSSPANVTVAVEGFNCKKIYEVAILIFVSLAVSLGIYFALPLSIAAVVIPVVLPIVIAISFIALDCFFDKVKSLQPKIPLSKTAPVGLANAGNDCWLNSLLQMVLIDRGLNKWFKEVPEELDLHARYFTNFSQDVLENLPEALPPEAYGILAEGDPRRQAIDNYANLIRGKTAEEKDILFTYTQFLRKFPLALTPRVTPQVVATVLLKFKEFVTVYEEGQRNKPGVALRRPATQNGAEPTLYSSHELRLILGRVCPQINLDGPNSQQDPTEVLPSMGEYLLPDHLKMQIRERQHYELPRTGTGELMPIPDAAEGNVTVKQEDPTVPLLNCPIQGSNPNMQDLLARYFDEPNSDPDNRIKRNVGGVQYEFPRVKTERQILHAPSALWLPPKRFCRTQSQWVGLHRMIPSLFKAESARTAKIDDSIQFQEVIEIQPVHGPLARYELDGFILHKGGCTGGHYISYKRDIENQGNRAWFLMDDSRITQVSEKEMRAALEKAYVPHYSKIEE